MIERIPITCGVRNRLIVSGRLAVGDESLHYLHYAFVPDRDTLHRDSFQSWLKEQSCATWEHLCAHVAETLMNELLPNWLRVTIWQQNQGEFPSNPFLLAAVEDCQPNKQRPSFIGLLPGVF